VDGIRRIDRASLIETCVALGRDVFTLRASFSRTAKHHRNGGRGGGRALSCGGEVFCG
jgi:hypothetical protein